MHNRLLCALFTLLVSLATAADRPNILYIYVDDMGWGSLGPNGQWAQKAKGLPHLITPTLDQLAREGVNFSNAYGCTVCSPARSSQQTGFHQGHTFADRNDPDNAKKAIRKDDITMGDALSAAGYTTGYWGKWGYGGSKDRDAPTIDNIETLPTSHGYEYVVAELHHMRAHTFFQPSLWSAPAPAKSIGGLHLIPNSVSPWIDKAGTPATPALQAHAKYPSVAYCDDVYAFAALDFVRDQAQTEAPFFGLIAFQVPHAPFDEVAKLPEWDAAYRDTDFFADLPAQAKQWAAMISRIDGHIHNLLAALEDPNGDGNTSDSVADNTLVIFQSDNGGPQQTANKHFNANGGLRAGKGSIYEGGIRVPTMMRWPAKITATSPLKAGSTSERLLDVTDLLPTFCELAGSPPPLGIDGVSIAPTLLDAGVQRQRDYIIHEAGKNASVITRDGTKLIRNKKGYEIYNVSADPGEAKPQKNVKTGEAGRLVKILIAERTDEAPGFAVNYHSWIGKPHSKTSDPKNWSDYIYANKGITYIEKSSVPDAASIVRIQTENDEDVRVVTDDEDLSMLALGIYGASDGDGKTSVFISQNLVAKNEIQVGPKAKLESGQGTTMSSRRIEILAGGQLVSNGTINAPVYNQGDFYALGLQLNGDLYCSEHSITIFETKTPTIVTGTAHLGGALQMPAVLSTKTITLMKAGKISGRFSSGPSEVGVVIQGEAKRIAYDIVYTDTEVLAKPR